MTFTYKEDVAKRTWQVYLKGPNEDSIATEFRGQFGLEGKGIGHCEENPSLMTEAGEQIKIHLGDDITISENVTFECVLLGVSADNYTALKTLINEPVDVQFRENVEAPYTTVTCIGMRIMPYLQIEGNQPKKILLTGSKEVKPGEGLTMVDEVTS